MLTTFSKHFYYSKNMKSYVFKLGKLYEIKVILESGYTLFFEGIFIQTTQKGFNFLNPTTNKCIFKKQQLYKNKGFNYFLLPNQIKINEKTNQ